VTATPLDGAGGVGSTGGESSSGGNVSGGGGGGGDGNGGGGGDGGGGGGNGGGGGGTRGETGEGGDGSRGYEHGHERPGKVTTDPMEASRVAATLRFIDGRGLHSSTFQLNLSRFRHCQTDATQRISHKALTLSCKGERV